MLAIARQNFIRQRLLENKSIRVSELAVLLQVTNETIRRDLRMMEENGELIRTHGGAYIIEPIPDPAHLTTTKLSETGINDLLADKCLDLIHDGDHIFLDNSDAAFSIAKLIQHRRLSILTPSFAVLSLLSASDSIRLFGVGGAVDTKKQCFSGDTAVRNLEQYYSDVTFISCDSVSMEAGLTDVSSMEAAIHKVALSHSKRKYLLVDPQKLDQFSIASVFPISVLTGIVLAEEPSAEWKQYLKKNQVSII